MADGTFFASNLSVQRVTSVKRVAATISTSLYEAALEAGATDQQVADFAEIFAFDIDFQREIQAGDAFEIVYETYTDERGNFVSSGDILFASLNGRALERSFYRHTPSDDNITDYFTADGKSATRFLMKTPINGARLSSSFGRRRHPISGYSRLHKGTDFAARSGTPIFAAGNGVVERASRYGGYGKYVRIQHANGYETAYAHMSRYGPGVRKGRRVRQGDIIGYVGSTGASTGPHLHYEVLVNGRHVNAMSLRLPTGRALEGDLLSEFEKKLKAIDLQRRALSEGQLLQATIPVIGIRSN
jgi:murein DD-endopeptidase MepM/ murein hydrolase activator NlpD